MRGVRRSRRRGVRARWVGALLVAAAFMVVVALPAAQAAPAPKPGSACKAKESGRVVRVGKQDLRCDRRGNAYRWSEVAAPSKAATGGTGGTSGATRPAVGSSCSTPGALDTTGLPTLACRGGKWRWATYDDAPRGPFTKRPSWYPPLAGLRSGGVACPKQGVVFTHSVLPEEELYAIDPYGALAGDHVTPMDHAGIPLRQWAPPRAPRTAWKWQPVMSPAAGVITAIEVVGSQMRVVIDHGCEVYSVYIVLQRASGVLARYAAQIAANESPRDVAMPVKAGQEFASQFDKGGFDFQVFDGRTWLRGLNPFSYLSGDSFKLYTADPANYFTPRLSRLYESILTRKVAPYWGKIDLDLPGSAQGNWFLRETNGYACWPVDKLGADVRTGNIPPGKKTYAWCHLALVPNSVDTGTWMASFGWWADPAGDPSQFVLEVEGKPTPVNLRPSHGVVVYRVFNWSKVNRDGSPIGASDWLTPNPPAGFRIVVTTTGSGTPNPPVGLVALRVNADDSLTVETLPGATGESQFSGFTAAARTYVH